MNAQEQAAADARDAQVKAAEEMTRKAMAELQRHGQAAAAVSQMGSRG
ncbi:hypothetical protein ABZ829_36450 [Streptomyces xanthochromogenes]